MLNFSDLIETIVDLGSASRKLNFLHNISYRVRKF